MSSCCPFWIREWADLRTYLTNRFSVVGFDCFLHCSMLFVSSKHCHSLESTTPHYRLPSHNFRALTSFSVSYSVPPFSLLPIPCLVWMTMVAHPSPPYQPHYYQSTATSCSSWPDYSCLAAYCFAAAIIALCSRVGPSGLSSQRCRCSFQNLQLHLI